MTVVTGTSNIMEDHTKSVDRVELSRDATRICPNKDGDRE